MTSLLFHFGESVFSGRYIELIYWRTVWRAEVVQAEAEVLVAVAEALEAEATAVLADAVVAADSRLVAAVAAAAADSRLVVAVAVLHPDAAVAQATDLRYTDHDEPIVRFSRRYSCPGDAADHMARLVLADQVDLEDVGAFHYLLQRWCCFSL